MSNRWLIKVLILSIIWLSFEHLVAQDEQENLGSSINSKFNELDPVLSPDGKKIYFTRSQHPENVGGKKDPGDVWVADLEAAQPGAATNLGAPINTDDLNAVVGFSSDGQIMYLHHLDKRRQGGISFVRKTANGWSKPKPMPVEFFHNKSDLQSMSISNDGKTIIMSLESYSTYGAEDLYVSFYQNDGSWSEPRNLGPTVNTRFQETTPKIADDNVTLFFSSNGHEGYGGRDIFVTERLDDTWRNWSEPKNLGPKVNTKGVELSYFIPQSGDFAYLISTQNSDGYGDVKRVPIRPADRPNETIESQELAQVSLPEPDTVLIISQEPISSTQSANETLEMINEIIRNPAVTIEGSVRNSETKNPVFAKINIFSEDNQLVNSIATNVSTGDFSLNIPSDSLLRIEVKAEGYIGDEMTVNVAAGEEGALDTDFELIPLEVGVTVQLPNVLFERSTTNLLDQSYEELDRVVKLLNDYPDMEIALSGHTDNQGSARLNLELSEDRVDTVILYLVGNGIARNRLSGKGYGGTKPIASNRSEATRKLNRRVEFTIVKK
jgi:outer membrane protein OmpA-like peptidoglycan-associated protein